VPGLLIHFDALDVGVKTQPALFDFNLLLKTPNGKSLKSASDNDGTPKRVMEIRTSQSLLN
jgi:hypothetical protein